MTHAFNRLCFLFLTFIVLAASLFAQAPTAAGTASPTTILAGLIDPTMLSPNFAAFGASSQPGTGGKINVSTTICHAITAFNYACAAANVGGSTTATTAQIQQVLLARAGVLFAVDAGAGVATGANSGAGLAVRTSGALMYNISRLAALKKYPGLWAGLNGSWDKRDVQELVQTSTLAALKPFASQGSYTLFLGYSWK